MKLHILCFTVSIFIGLFSCSTDRTTNNSQLSDSTLIAIRNGFDTRVAEYFEEQKTKQ